MHVSTVLWQMSTVLWLSIIMDSRNMIESDPSFFGFESSARTYGIMSILRQGQSDPSGAVSDLPLFYSSLFNFGLSFTWCRRCLWRSRLAVMSPSIDPVARNITIITTTLTALMVLEYIRFLSDEIRLVWP
ncbi:hypothetical protein BDR07DRAFT_1017046 [Suillus spraguei]|nr:hypothetical protein BDR07DRAFT_1017046 [Suillus spraguei]